LNIAAAWLARSVPTNTPPGQAALCRRSIGPPPAALAGHIGYDAMAAAYREQAEALIEAAWTAAD